MDLKKLFIGIPILNRLDLLARCIDAIDYPSEIVVINNNTTDDSFKRQINELAQAKGFTVLHQERNLGVSASWNLVVRTAFSKGYDWAVIGSNDTFLHPGSLKAAAEMKKEDDIAIWELQGFNFFLLRKQTIERVGWFDENFYPAYKEDQDFHYRCSLAGVRMVRVPDASAEHFGSATIRSNSAYAAANAKTHHGWNTHYYCLKWGGDRDSEEFVHPYNNPEHDHRWWPDPRANLPVLDWDGTSRQRAGKPDAKQADQVKTRLEEMYQAGWQTRSDICEHVPVLRFYAGLCRHVTEFVRTSVSTIALLSAQPARVVSCNLSMSPQIKTLLELPGPTEFVALRRFSLDMEIEPTDLLFIDGFHTYWQLKRELALHHSKVGRFIILHDIVSFGFKDEIEDGSAPCGLVPALREFLEEHPEWKIEQLYWNCNGLAVLRKEGAFC